jgi:predicted DNA-binding ribbon-helix-helix protein
MPPPYRILTKYPDGAVLSQNVTVGSRRTSLRLGKETLGALREIAAREGLTLRALCTLVANTKYRNKNLTEALRSYVLRYFREAATEEGHKKAGHGRAQDRKRAERRKQP